MLGFVSFVAKLAWFAAKAQLRGDREADQFARSLVWESDNRLECFAAIGPLTLPQVQLSELVGGMEVSLLAPDLDSEDGSTDPYETICLAALTRFVKPLQVFEIGTFKGQRTVLFAQHTQPASRILTLDLDPATLQELPHRPEEGDLKYICKPAIGEYIARFPQRDRVTQLVGNSMTFDFSPYFGQCDFIFVDAAHSYEYVKSDSQQAFKMLKPGGVILWHDYRPGCPGVVRALHEVSHTHLLFHLRGTALVVCGLNKLESQRQNTDPVARRAAVGLPT